MSDCGVFDIAQFAICRAHSHSFTITFRSQLYIEIYVDSSLTTTHYYNLFFRFLLHSSPLPFYVLHDKIATNTTYRGTNFSP